MKSLPFQVHWWCPNEIFIRGKEMVHTFENFLTHSRVLNSGASWFHSSGPLSVDTLLMPSKTNWPWPWSDVPRTGSDYALSTSPWRTTLAYEDSPRQRWGGLLWDRVNHKEAAAKRRFCTRLCTKMCTKTYKTYNRCLRTGMVSGWPRTQWWNEFRSRSFRNRYKNTYAYLFVPLNIKRLLNFCLQLQLHLNPICAFRIVWYFVLQAPTLFPSSGMFSTATHGTSQCLLHLTQTIIVSLDSCLFFRKKCT